MSSLRWVKRQPIPPLGRPSGRTHTGNRHYMYSVGMRLIKEPEKKLKIQAHSYRLPSNGILLYERRTGQLKAAKNQRESSSQRLSR